MIWGIFSDLRAWGSVRGDMQAPYYDIYSDVQVSVKGNYLWQSSLNAKESSGTRQVIQDEFSSQRDLDSAEITEAQIDSAIHLGAQLSYIRFEYLIPFFEINTGVISASHLYQIEDRDEQVRETYQSQLGLGWSLGARAFLTKTEKAQLFLTFGFYRFSASVDNVSLATYEDYIENTVSGGRTNTDRINAEISEKDVNEGQWGYNGSFISLAYAFFYPIKKQPLTWTLGVQFDKKQAQLDVEYDELGIEEVVNDPLQIPEEQGQRVVRQAKFDEGGSVTGFFSIVYDINKQMSAGVTVALGADNSIALLCERRF